MKTKTNIKAGGRRLNHSQTLVGSGLKTQTQLKAGIGGIRRRRVTG